MQLYTSKSNPTHFALDLTDAIPLFNSVDTSINYGSVIPNMENFTFRPNHIEPQRPFDLEDLVELSVIFREILTTAEIVSVEYFNREGRRYILDKDFLKSSKKGHDSDDIFRYYIIVELKSQERTKTLYLHMFTSEFKYAYDRIYVESAVISNLKDMKRLNSTSFNFDNEVYKKGNLATRLDYAGLFPMLWMVVKDAFAMCPVEIGLQLANNRLVQQLAFKYNIEELKVEEKEERYEQ